MFKWLTAPRTIVESCSDPAKSCWEPAKSEQCTYRAEAGNSRIGWEEGWKAGFDNSRPSSVHSEHSVDVRGRQIWSQSILANFRWMAFEIRSQKCNFSQVFRVTVETGIIHFSSVAGKGGSCRVFRENVGRSV